MLSPNTLGHEPRDWLLAQDLVPPDALPAWRGMVDAALQRVDAAFAAAAPLKMLRLHGDCHLGNILWTAAGPHFVDLDDALTGPAVQDLWMLLSGPRAERQTQLGAVLDGYEQFMDFDRRELALIEPLRTLRIVHHSAWIARRTTVSIVYASMHMSASMQSCSCSRSSSVISFIAAVPML